MKQKVKAHFGIKLNENTKIHVSEGSLVDKGDKLISFPMVDIKVYNDPKLLKMSAGVWDQINQEKKGKPIKKGEPIFKSGGIFSTLIAAPMDGIFGGIDEFGNIRIEIYSDEEKEIKSPVKAVISKIDKDKITLEFSAVEFKGEGLVEGKAWGETDLRIIDKILDLNYEFDGQVVLVNEVSQTFLTKAEVLGVAAVVTDKKEIDLDKINSNLPILFLDGSEWDKLFEFKGAKRQVLINAKTGRLLVVIE